MSLIYRAVWQDSRADIFSVARNVFSEWVSDKSNGQIDAPVLGHAMCEDQSVRVVERTTGEQRALFATHHHELDDATWTLTLGVVAGEEADSSWAWVDLEHTAEDPYGRPPPVSAPRIVKRLIASGDAQLGSTSLTISPLLVPENLAAGLAGQILDPRRAVPLVAFSTNRDLTQQENLDQVRLSAEHLAGAATVAYLHPDAEAVLERMLPAKMAVFGGPVRIYLPGVDPESPKPWRHRWYGADRRTKKQAEFPQILARELSPRMALRRPPTLRALSLVTDFPGDQGYFAELLQRRDAELQRVELQFERSEAHRLGLRSELCATLTQAYEERHGNDRADEPSLLTNGPFTLVGDLLGAASTLPLVSIASAVVEPPTLGDSAEDDPLALIRLRCALTALHEFSLSEERDLQDWVEQHRPIGVAREALVVRKALDSDPLLPIDERVSPAGTIRMGNQLRGSAIDEDQIVVRFHDDRDGRTGQIHVGYLGSESGIANYQNRTQ